MKGVLTEFFCVPERSDVLAFCAGELPTTRNADFLAAVDLDPSTLFLSVTADQLRPGSRSLEDRLHRTLRLPVGHLPLLFTTERRWHVRVGFRLPSRTGGQGAGKAPREMRSQGFPDNDDVLFLSLFLLLFFF